MTLPHGSAQAASIRSWFNLINPIRPLLCVSLTLFSAADNLLSSAWEAAQWKCR